VPVIHFHGLQDRKVLFGGGVGPNQVQPVAHRSIPDTIAWWVQVNRCGPRPEVARLPDRVVEKYTPRPGAGGAPVELVKLPCGGHTWPGGVDVTAHLDTGPLVASVDASTLMWSFFDRFALPGPDN
jgi:poly(3-hydroxybutyrate) depolymerase